MPHTTRLLIRATLALFFVGCLAVYALSAQAQQLPCHQIQSGGLVAANFGAPYSFLLPTKPLLITAQCTPGSARVVAGSGSSFDYVYQLGYEWVGNTWQQFALTGTQQAGEWVIGEAWADRPTVQNADAYVVAYICQWDGAQWKCGCRDAACATPSWQLQTYRNVQAGNTSSGGSTSSGGTSSGGSTTSSTSGGGKIPGGTGNPGDVAGLFYGLFTSGDHTGNGRMFEHQGSRRFVAQKTGTVDAVTYENRVLLQYQIDARFPTCKNNGLDPISCGYTMGGPYHVGNGGRICIEIQTDDGSSNHLPSGQVIGKARNCFTPIDLKDVHFPAHELESPVQLEAGEIYHLVLNQTAPPGNCRSGHSVSQARSCPRNKGLISFNGTYNSAGLPDNPFGGSIEANLTRDSSGGSWRKDGEERAWYGLRYTDDQKWYGWLNTYYRAYYTTTQNGNHIIGGSKRARQKFTVRGKSYQVNGLWVRAARSGGGGSLKVDVKDASGQVISSGSYNTGEFPNNCGSRCSGDWAYTDLSSTVTLQEGQTYTAEFSGSNISLQTGFPLDYGAFNIPGDGGSWWNDAQAEVSTNGGSSWSGYSGDYFPKRDLSMLFTLVGQPKSYLQ